MVHIATVDELGMIALFYKWVQTNQEELKGYQFPASEIKIKRIWHVL